jgi:hypothetical protein
VTAVVCALALAHTTACYAYRPVSGPLPPAQQQVRLRLTTEGTLELARYLGPRVEAVEGSLASARTDTSLTVAVEWVQTVDGVHQPWTGEGNVVFPMSYLSRVELSTLDRSRTSVAALALTAGLIALAATALRSTRSQGGTGPSPGGPPP